MAERGGATLVAVLDAHDGLSRGGRRRREAPRPGGQPDRAAHRGAARGGEARAGATASGGGRSGGGFRGKTPATPRFKAGRGHPPPPPPAGGPARRPPAPAGGTPPPPPPEPPPR